MYFLFPETKGRTLEEIGHVFGDDVHVATQWYGASDDDKQKIEAQALRETEGGIVHEKTLAEASSSQVEDNSSGDKGTTTINEDVGKP